MRLWIIKLGGSIITDKKSGKPAVLQDVITTICTELADALAASPDLRLVILHGAGSVGHPLAHEYDLINKPLNPKRLIGMGKTMANMRRLTHVITKALHQLHLPALPLQASSLGYMNEQGDFKLTGIRIIETILKTGGIPVLAGDTVVTLSGNVAIASADTLAVALAQTLQAQRILFFTDVDGVYDSFPPTDKTQLIPSLSRQEIEGSPSSAKVHATDVTGGMQGKLRALLPLQNIEVVIFNGVIPANIRAAFAEEAIGTTIRL
ncbi:MAG: isopentenyl phosphate kinase [Candidatus Andersenbacteria bacterium]